MKNEFFVESYNNHTPDDAARERMLDSAYEKASVGKVRRLSRFTFAHNIYAIATSAAAVCILFAGIWFMLPHDDSIIAEAPHSSGSVAPPDTAAPPPVENSAVNPSQTDSADIINPENPINPAQPENHFNPVYTQRPAATVTPIVPPIRPPLPTLPAQPANPPAPPFNPPVVNPPPFFPPIINPPVVNPPTPTVPQQLPTEPPVTVTAPPPPTEGGHTTAGSAAAPPPPTTPAQTQPQTPPPTIDETDSKDNEAPSVDKNHGIGNPSVSCVKNCANRGTASNITPPNSERPPWDDWISSDPRTDGGDDDWCGNMNCVVYENGRPCYCNCKCTIFDLY